MMNTGSNLFAGNAFANTNLLVYLDIQSPPVAYSMNQASLKGFTNDQ